MRYIQNDTTDALKWGSQISSGLPKQYAGLASIAAAGLTLGLVELQANAQFGGVAGWLLLSLVYGLAAAGFYSQVRKLTEG